MAADNKLGAIPKLEEIAENPALASHLSPNDVEALLGKNAVVQSVLVSRLLALRASLSREERSTSGDRLLDVEEASRKLGKSKDYLYRHASDYPFTVRDGRSLRFSDQGIEKFIRQRMAR